MGYRTYIGQMKKRDYNKIKSLSSVAEVYAHFNTPYDPKGYDGDYLGVYDFGVSLYEFGKWTEFEPPKGSIKPFFKKKDVQKYWGEEHDFYVATPDFLRYVIEHYTLKIKNYHREMLSPFFDEKGSVIHPLCKSGDIESLTKDDIPKIFEVINHVHSFATEWGEMTFLSDMLPYNLNKGESVTTSWKYEYSLFELIRIYKTFDWKRNVLVYYGY